MTTTDQLSNRIAQVIQEHLAASERAATEAITCAFSMASRQTNRARLTPQPRSGARRRPSEEIATLGGQLYRAICAKPGETMAVLAADVGSSPRAMNRPMTHLRRLGQVRSVGQRNLTRYFPLAAKS